MANTDAASEIRALLENREQILVYATSGGSDSFSSMDSKRLDDINEMLSSLGVSDSSMTVEQFDDDLDRGLITLPRQQSQVGTAFDRFSNWLSGGDPDKSQLEQRIAKISSASAYDHG